MPRYYFDLRDHSGLFVDDEGLDFRDVQVVREEASRALAEMARDAMRKAIAPVHQMAIEVRDETGPVMQVRISFEIDSKE
jgi:uncharacterized protein DUF6894